MAGKQTVVKLGEIVKWAKEGRLSKVKSAAQNEALLSFFGERALREAALAGHLDVVMYLRDREFISFIGKYGIDYREVMANAPDEIKEWYREETDGYIRMDAEWQRMIDEDDVDADSLLAPPDSDAYIQQPLLTAACAGQFPAAIDMLIGAGRVNELTADHFLYSDADSTLIGYLVALGGLQDAFRPAIWVGRTAELEKLWNMIPETVRPEVTLTDIFEDTRHHEWLQMVRRKKWPRLKGTEKPKKQTRSRRSGKK